MSLLIAEVDELIGNDGLNGDEEGMVDVGDEETGGVEEEQDKGDKDLLEDVEKVVFAEQTIQYVHVKELLLPCSQRSQ